MRIFSAFLFAITLIILLFGGFWYYTMDRYESLLVQTLNNTFKGSVSYQSVQWQYDPRQIHMTLRNVHVKVKKENIIYDHKLSRVELYADFFSSYKLQMKLPQKQEIIVSKNENKKYFQLQMSGGMLSFYKNVSAKSEVSLTYNLLLIHHKNAAIFSSKAGYINYRLQEITKNNNMLVGVNLGAGNIRFFLNSSKKPTLKTGQFFADLELLASPQWSKIFFPFLVETNLQGLKQSVRAFLTEVKSNKLNINDMRWIHNQKSTGILASLSLDARGRLQGGATITTNNIEDFKALLLDIKLLPSRSLIFNDKIKRALKHKKGSRFLARVDVEQGLVKINGINAGLAPSLEEMLRLKH